MLNRKRTKADQQKLEVTDFSDLVIEQDAVELMQVVCTEFICFVTSDAVESVREQGRVAIKEQDIMEALDNLGFDHYLFVLETQMRFMKL